jgi:hypothetical protein
MGGILGKRAGVGARQPGEGFHAAGSGAQTAHRATDSRAPLQASTMPALRPSPGALIGAEFRARGGELRWVEM